MNDPSWSDAPFDEEFDEDLRDRIKAEVDPDEPVVWAGRPVPRTEPSAAVTVGFALFDVLLIGGSVASVVYAIRGRPPDSSGPIFLGVVALLIAFFVTLGLISAGKRRKSAMADRVRTSYALTARRVIVWQPVSNYYGAQVPTARGGIQVFSHPRSTIRSIHRVEYPDGSGDIVIRRPDGDAAWNGCNLLGIADVRRVERLFRGVLRVGEANEELRGK